jgi:tetratricopeptide (TPR) repeat protein
VVPELEVDEDDAAASDLELDDDVEIELDEEVPDLEGGEPSPAPPAAPTAEADPSQLLAEAGVYLRYSQHDKAVACLEQILDSEPEHRDALIKLGEARRALGEESTAVVLWRRAALCARAEGDEAAFETLCERVRELDAETADALAAEPGPSAAKEGGSEAAEALPELDLTSELEGAVEGASDEAPAAPSVADAAAPSAEEAAAPSAEEAAAPSAEEAAAPSAEEAAATFAEEAAATSADATQAVAPELDVDVDEILESTGSSLGGETGARVEDPQASGPDAEGAFGTGGGSLGGSADTGEVSAEDLEEAEFYYRQGLYDEAEQILKRLLAVAPGHPQVLLRLGEIARSRGESPCSPVADGVDFDTTEEEDASPGVDPAAVPPAPPVDESAAFAEEDEGAADTAAGDDLLSDDTIEDWDAEPATGGAPAGPDELTLQADAALDADSGGDTLGGETAPTLDGMADVVDGVDDATPPQPVAADGEGFDLAAELSGIFDEDPESTAGELTAGGTTQAGFESIFQSFKQGVKETLGEGEHETHYDLGIAYREMGLLEDAINEFRVAMDSSARKLDCLALMGLCALDLGRAGDAVGHLEQALAMPGLDEQRIAGLRFDLGRAFELQGDLDRARSVWEQVLDFDPEFPDLRERLERLGQADESPSLGELDPDLSDTGEVFESFDDLIAEAEADEVGSDGDGEDDPDDPGDGPDDADPGDRSGGDSSGDMGSTQWGRKISYG